MCEEQIAVKMLKLGVGRGGGGGAKILEECGIHLKSSKNEVCWNLAMLLVLAGLLFCCGRCV